MHNLREWLPRVIGAAGGDKKRQGLYDKLVRLQRRYGEAVDLCIAEVYLRATELATRKHFSYWFCKGIKLRLIERHLWLEPSIIDGKSKDQILSMAFQDNAAPLFDGPNEPPPPAWAAARASLLDRVAKPIE